MYLHIDVYIHKHKDNVLKLICKWIDDKLEKEIDMNNKRAFMMKALICYREL